jgi:ABC-type dipeptide/oligopeptide/nickel transport system ATPase subunit
MGDDLKFKHPFTCILSGPTGSGKTSFCIKILQNLDSLSTEINFNGGISWCYTERTAVPSQQLASLKTNIKYDEGVPEENDIGDAHGRPSLLILDDLLNQVYSQKVCNLFTKGSHHRNISLILIAQNLFHQGRFCRDAKYVVLLKNARDKKQFSYLAQQVYPENINGLYKATRVSNQRLPGRTSYSLLCCCSRWWNESNPIITRSSKS